MRPATCVSESVPEAYDLLVPGLFAPPAEVTAATVATWSPRSVLETAAGTGVVTRALRESVAADITATDLSPSMLDRGRETGRFAGVIAEPADMLALPFPDASFDAVVCQFGVMFVAHKAAVYAEARRVLTAGGRLLVTAWDALEVNPIVRIVTEALDEETGDIVLGCVGRIGHDYHDHETVERDLRAAGFEVAIERRRALAATTATDAAIGLCAGTPLRAAIEDRPGIDLARAIEVATLALEWEYGRSRFEAPIRWIEADATAVSPARRPTHRR